MFKLMEKNCYKFRNSIKILLSIVDKKKFLKCNKSSSSVTIFSGYETMGTDMRYVSGWPYCSLNEEKESIMQRN